jgi:hypothetical protein
MPVGQPKIAPNKISKNLKAPIHKNQNRKTT